MRVKGITINGKEIKGFDHLRVWGTAPSESGFPGVGHTLPLRFEFSRQITGIPSVMGFDLATNSDGTLAPVDAAIEIQNARGKSTYYFEISDGYVESWGVRDEGRTGEGPRERWVVRAGQIKLTVGSQVAGFTLPTELIPQ